MKNGVIDITETVEQMRQAWVDYSINVINGFEAATPSLQWLNIPLVNTIEESILRQLLTALSNSMIQQAFFLNTALKKPSQALDFTAAARALRELPEDASDEEYKKHEEARMAAFRAFVPLTT